MVSVVRMIDILNANNLMSRHQGERQASSFEVSIAPPYDSEATP